MPREVLDEVRVEVNGGRKGTNAFVYVNDGFAGSTSDVAESRTASVPPNAGVYREQYCVCSRWPYTQRALAIAVGVLLGALIGLGVSFALKGEVVDPIGPIFNK